MTTIAPYDVSTIVNRDTAPYHRFLRQGLVKMQCCSQCGYIRYPSRPTCPECLSDDAEWQSLPGTGTVKACVWYFNDAYDAAYDVAWAWREIPYNVALVKLDSGPTFLSNVVGTTFDALKPGQAIQPVFVPVADDYAILRFKIG